MRASIARRWKLKERSYNQKYKLKTTRRPSQPRDFSGKFLFLLSKSNLCTILKFLSRNVCVTAAVVTISPLLVRQISPRYVLSSRKNKRLIAQSEVRITKEFEECFARLFKSDAKACSSVVKKITPIKITSCKICKLKLIKSALDEHIARVHGSIDSESSRSGDELFIDDDVELMLDNGLDNADASDDVDKPHICLQCPEKFATEASLLDHIDNIHPIKIKSNAYMSEFPSLYPIKNNHTAGPSTSTSKQRKSNHSSDLTPENKTTFKRRDTKSKYVCRICSVKFQVRMHLNRHVTSFHISKVFRCYRCKVSYDKVHTVLKHLRNAHAKFANEVGFIRTCNFPESVCFFQCGFCKFSSKERQAVDDHVTNEHYEDFEKPELIEEVNSTSPDSLDELLLPETRAKLSSSMNEEDNEEEDLLMELVTANPTDGHQKLRKTANDPSFPYRCARCLRRFSRSHYLKKHPCKAIKPEPPSPKRPKLSNEVNGFFKCTNKPCNKVFTDRKHFDEHQKIHKT